VTVTPRLPLSRLLWLSLMVFLAELLFIAPLWKTLDGASLPGSLNSLRHLPVLEHLIEVEGTRIPLWWAAPGAGDPVFASGAGGFLFATPLVYLAGLLGSRVALTSIFVLGFLLAFTGFYRFARNLLYPVPFALLGAFLFSASPLGLGFFSQGYYDWGWTLAFLPWCIDAFHRAFSQRRSLVTPQMVLPAVGIALLSGMVFWLIVFIIIAVFTLFLEKRFSRRTLVSQIRGSVGWLILLPLFMAGMTALPHWEFLRWSERVSNSLVDSPPVNWLSVILPLSAGAMSFQPCITLGSLLAIIYCCVNWRRLITIFPKMFLCSLFVIGGAVAIYAALGEKQYTLPGFAHVIAALLLSFAVALAVPFILWRMLRFERETARKVGVAVFAFGMLLILGATVLWLFLPDQNAPRPSLVDDTTKASGLAALTKHVSDALVGLTVAAEKQIFTVMYHALLITFSGLILFAASGSLKYRYCVSALALIFLIDARLFSDTPPAAPSEEPVAPSSLLVEKIKEDAASRCLAVGASPSCLSSLMAQGVNVLDCLTAPVPSGFARAYTLHPLLNPKASVRQSEQSQWLYLGNAGVRWVVAGSGSPQQSRRSIPFAVVVDQQGLQLYEITKKSLRVQPWQKVVRVVNQQQAFAMTLALDWTGDEVYIEGISPATVPQRATKGSLGQAFLRWERGNYLVADVSVPSESVILFSDAYYPGWRAWLGASPVPIYRANGWMRAVAVPAGQSCIRMMFAPYSFVCGTFVTFLTLGISLVILISSQRRGVSRRLAS